MPTCANCTDYYDVVRPHFFCNKEKLAAQVVRITDYLKTKGLTRHEIAQAISADERSIGRWRKAQTRPSPDHMRALRDLERKYQ